MTTRPATRETRIPKAHLEELMDSRPRGFDPATWALTQIHRLLDEAGAGWNEANGYSYIDPATSDFIVVTA